MKSKLGQAVDPTTSAEILEGLARDSDYSVAFHIARHVNATPKILTQLASWRHDSFENYIWVIRDQVSRHPNCPPLVKIWLQGYYSDLTLEEFLEAVQ